MDMYGWLHIPHSTRTILEENKKVAKLEGEGKGTTPWELGLYHGKLKRLHVKAEFWKN